MSWDEIIGQDVAKRQLQTHLVSGRVPNGYLLAGPDGVGKRRLALEVAKALNCTAEGSTPCDACRTCTQIAKGTHPDVHVLSPAGASEQIRIDVIRHLLGRLALAPFSARFQVAIIEGAERLTEEAANALLKALEEPSIHGRFLLTTARLSDCLPTIVSRCQLIRCRPLPVELITKLVASQQPAVGTSAAAVARLSGGSASQALALAGRWESSQQLHARFASEQPLDWVTQPLPESRQEVAQLLDGMMAWLRDVAVAAATDGAVAHAAQERAIRRQAQTVDLDCCLQTVVELVALRDSLEQFVSPRLVATVAREKWLTLLNA